jgi:L-serine---[L-seryl-carrier protein] ligase
MGDRPLSTVQSGVWFGQQLDPANPAFNIGGYVDIDGAVDPVQFQAALRMTVLETEALHVRFVVDHEGVPAQVVTAPPDWPMRYVDVSGEPDPERAAAGWMADDMATPVGLTRDPLFVHALLKLAPDRYYWYFRCHHIVLDGWGIWLFGSRVAEIYTANSTGQPLPPGLPAALDRIAEEDAAYRRSARFADDRAYWIERLAGRPPAVGLAGRPAPAGHRVHRHTGYLPVSLVDALGGVARSTAATWPSVVVAAVAGYVRRHTNAPEVVLGFPVSGRWGATAKRTPGMMSTILPLRLAAPDGVRFGDLVRAASQEMRQALRHQRYTAEDLRRELRLVGRTEALSAVSVNVMPFDYRLTFGACPSVMHMLSSGPVEDLAISVHAPGCDGRVRIDVEGNPALYEPEELRAIHERVVRVLEAGCADPDTVLDDYELLDEAERRRVLVDFNHTAHPVPDTTLTALLEVQARTSPAATALVAEGVEVSYAELHRRANRMARELIRHGAAPGTLVAVAVPRSVELVVSLLAVLKTGAAYLPLDPDYPVDRLDFMLRDARPVLVATVRDVFGALPVDAPVLVLDEPGTAAMLAARDGSALDARTVDPRDAAYVIYTSGSTGVPKGVVVPHRGIVNRLLWMQHRYGLTPQDRVLQKTPASFDVSVWEFFWPLLTGATLVLARPGGHKDPRYLAELIRTERVSTVHFVPSMLREFLSEPDAAGCRGLRRVICSGEALPAELAARVFEVLDTELHNLYGPTEASVDVTAWECRPEPGAVVPIGQPVWNTQMYVLDRRHRPVPVGVVGELHRRRPTGRRVPRPAGPDRGTVRRQPVRGARRGDVPDR